MKVTTVPRMAESKFKKGNVLTSKDNGSIVLITGTPAYSECFEGVLIDGASSDIGLYCTDWRKSSFTQFHGTITIEL